MKQRFDNQYPICNSSFDYTYDLLEQQNRAFRHIGIRSWLDEDSLFDHHFISRSVVIFLHVLYSLAEFIIIAHTVMHREGRRMRSVIMTRVS
jgi:hypothetical protein